MDNWKNRKNWTDSYWNNHSHRQLIIDELKKIEFDSILEVGSACGYNLNLIQKEFNVKVEGIDINQEAVEFGRNKGLNLKIGTAEELNYPTKSVDVILTDACLIYVHPKEIKKVIINFTKIARKALVFCEFYHKNKLGEKCFDNWGRNYQKLLLDIGFKTIKVKISKEIWNEPNWKECGYLFITKL